MKLNYKLVNTALAVYIVATTASVLSAVAMAVFYIDMIRGM